MKTVYTRRLVLASIVTANVFQDLFTAAPDVTTILRDVLITIPSGAPGFVAIDVLHGTTDYRLIQLTDLTTDTYHLDLRQEIQPGEIVKGFSSVPNTYLALTGYEFSS